MTQTECDIYFGVGLANNLPSTKIKKWNLRRDRCSPLLKPENSHSSYHYVNVVVMLLHYVHVVWC